MTVLNKVTADDKIEEIQCGEIIQSYLNLTEDKRTKKEERKFIQAKETLVKKYEKLIYKIANNFYYTGRPSSIDIDDMIQELFEEAWITTEKYDPNKNTKFGTYLVPRLKKKCDVIKESSRIINIGVYGVGKLVEYNTLREEYDKEKHGDYNTYMSKSPINYDSYMTLNAAVYGASSLEQPLSDNTVNEDRLLDIVEDKNILGVDSGIILLDVLKEVVKYLTPEEADLLLCDLNQTSTDTIKKMPKNKYIKEVNNIYEKISELAREGAFKNVN